MNGYIAFFNGRKIELHADTLYSAKLKALEIFKPRKSQAHMVHVELAEKAGAAVIHVAVN